MSARPYRVTWTWQDGRAGRAAFSTRKAAEAHRAELLAIAEGMRDGTWLIAMSNNQPVEPGPGEVVERDDARGIWVRKLPAAKITVRITKKVQPAAATEAVASDTVRPVARPRGETPAEEREELTAAAEAYRAARGQFEAAEARLRAAANAAFVAGASHATIAELAKISKSTAQKYVTARRD